MSPPGDRREPLADTKCPPAAQRKQAKRACLNYSRLSLTRTPRDRGDLYSLSGVRINRSTYIATFVQNA